MQIPDIIRSQDRWLLHATIGLGLCLASTEYERYTGLWIFETRSFVQLILIVALLIVVLGIFIQKTRKSDVRLSHGKTLIIILILLQSIGLSGRLAQMLAIPLPAWFSLFAPLAMQSAGILFLLYAEFFLEVGIKKSLRSLALGILIAGILQVFTMGLPPIITIPLLYTFMPISGFLLIFADRRRSEVHRESEREDVLTEVSRDERATKGLPFWEYPVSIMLLTILMLALHSQGMTHQDGGEGSRMIQSSAGFGSIVSGLMFLAILRSLEESEFMELFRLLVLPLLLVALYISSLVGGIEVAIYLILLGVSYSIVLLFVWAAPRSFQKSGKPFLYTCFAYFSYRLGWALGIFGIMIFPTTYGDSIETGIILTAFFVLLILNAIRLILNRRNAVRKTGKSVETQTETELVFNSACDHIAKRYHLTPREGEVLTLLAKGRNAKYITEALVISDGTARTHIMHIYQKMTINSQQVLMDYVENEMERPDIR